MTRQLVILGSGVTALAVVRSAHRLGLTAVVLDTERDIATASRLARVETYPGKRPEELVPRLVALGQRSGSCVISTTDAWLRVLAAHRPELERAYERILHPGNEALALCLSKDKFAAWCEDKGLPAPRQYRVAPDFRPDETCSLPFPLLLRPAETLHSRPVPGLLKAVEVRCAAELARWLDAFRGAGVAPALSQSLLDRPLTQYSVGLARTGGRTMTVVARKIRPLPEACSAGTLVEATEQPEVESLARRAADLLDYEGIAEIEVLRDQSSGECFLIEVNARPWVQFALGPAAGRDLLRFALSTGGVGHDHAGSGRRPLWLDFHGDLYVCFNRDTGLVRTGKLSFRGYLRSVARADVFARWSLADRGPFWRDLRTLIVARFK